MCVFVCRIRPAKSICNVPQTDLMNVVWDVWLRLKCYSVLLVRNVRLQSEPPQTGWLNVALFREEGVHVLILIRTCSLPCNRAGTSRAPHWTCWGYISEECFPVWDSVSVSLHMQAEEEAVTANYPPTPHQHISCNWSNNASRRRREELFRIMLLHIGETVCRGIMKLSAKLQDKRMTSGGCFLSLCLL